ncbi:MAG TPA: hypothetical protein VFC28_01360 [Opitutaceae bacterium]|jgi:hypothetical protein|nr:hypothetical protein [Opitutaceae bacterium]
MTTNEPQPIPTVAAPQGVKPQRLIKLGVDLHWHQYVVVRQIDGTSPQPPQRFAPEAFVAWAAKQVALADAVQCCYEAGPFGSVLHKRLVALGINRGFSRR